MENNEDIFSFQRRIVAQIVKEQDEYTMNMLEEYAKSQPDVDLSIIPEGKFRHIVNLGLTVFNDIQKEPRKLMSRNYFSESVYTEYLLQQISELAKQNEQLRQRVEDLQIQCGLLSTTSNIDMLESELKDEE